MSHSNNSTIQQSNISTLQIHSIESFGTHDGPGLRLVIFLQGCNIRCQYCHNPDTISIQGGTETNIEELVERAIRMKPYFGNEGGVTVSGGEPMLQSKALIPFFEALAKENIHTNIDTNGTVRTSEAQALLSNCADLVMFDVKSTTPEGFKSLTGHNHLENVLANIALREASKKPYWLRYVLIPNITDSDESIEWVIANFSKNKYIEKLEILPYHKLGLHKWEKLGWEYTLENVIENTEEQIYTVFKKLEKHFKSVRVS